MKIFSYICFFFYFYFYFILLYNTVLVLPYIDMNRLSFKNTCYYLNFFEVIEQDGNKVFSSFLSLASKVMLKIFQARFQQYMNHELPDIQTGFREGRGARDQIVNIHWIIKKAKEFQKNIYFCFIDYAKAFDCVDHNTHIAPLNNSSHFAVFVFSLNKCLIDKAPDFLSQLPL